MSTVIRKIDGGLIYHASLCNTCKGKKLFPSDGSENVLSICSTCDGLGTHPVLQIHMLDKTLPGLLEELLAGTPVQLELPVFPELALPPGRISIYKMASASREPNWSSHPISYKEFLAGKRPTWEKTNIVQEPR